MADLQSVQTEKAVLKQPKVFLCSKKSGKVKRPGKVGNRSIKDMRKGIRKYQLIFHLLRKEITYFGQSRPFSKATIRCFGK
ncbi:hypothetical protein SUGI_0897800 [Cryptomeria japonica]|nr:hypothetical protein SUGI_0897800 [Cryptomeria japonica]